MLVDNQHREAIFVRQFWSGLARPVPLNECETGAAGASCTDYDSPLAVPLPNDLTVELLALVDA